MKNVFPIVTAVILLLSGVSFAEAKEKKQKKTAPAKTVKSAPTATPVPSAPAVPKEWTEVQTDSPTLVRVAYKFDGHYINIKFQNLSTERTVRIRYQTRWQKNVSGKWVEDVSAEGLTLRLRKQEDMVVDVLTRSPNIKDVSIFVEASEVL